MLRRYWTDPSNGAVVRSSEAADVGRGSSVGILSALLDRLPSSKGLDGKLRILWRLDDFGGVGGQIR